MFSNSIKIFLACSIDEFESERDKLENFINRLSRIFQSQGYDVDIEPVRCEGMSQVTRTKAQQSAIDDLVRESQFCYVIFGNEAGKYTVHEYDVAMEQFEKTGKEPRVVVSIKKRPAGEIDSQSIRDFVAHRYEKHSHYTNRFDNIDSIKVTILMELLSSDLLRGIGIEVRYGNAWIGQSSLGEIISLNRLPMYANNDVLQLKYVELKQKQTLRLDLIEKTKNEPNNLSTAKALQSIDKSISDISAEIHQIENDVLRLYQRIIENDRKDCISERDRRATEALEIGDYDTALAIYSSEQWKTDLENARTSIETSKKIKKIAEENISNQIDYINQEIASQRMRIAILKAHGITDESVKLIYSIYAEISKYAKEYKIEQDLVCEYAEFLLEQCDFDSAIKIAKANLPENEENDLIVGKLYAILGRAYRSKNQIEEAEKYADLLISRSEKNVSQDRISQTLLAEAYLLKVKCLPLMSPEFDDYVNKAIGYAKEISRYNAERALMIEIEALYHQALNKRAFAEIPELYRIGDEGQHYYNDAIKAFTEGLKRIAEREGLLPDETIKQQRCIWLNSFANLYKWAETYGIDEFGYKKAEPIRREVFEIFQQLYSLNHDKYAQDYALACQTLGNLLRVTYRLDESKKLHEISLRVFRLLAERDLDANGYDYTHECQNMAHILVDIGEFSKAEAIAKEGLQLCRDFYSKNSKFVNRCDECETDLLLHLSIALIEQGKRRAAIHIRKEYLHKALSVFWHREISSYQEDIRNVSETVMPYCESKTRYQIIEEGRENELENLFAEFYKKEKNNRKLQPALENRSAMILIAEKLAGMNYEKYKLQYAESCVLMGVLSQSSLTQSQRNILFRNACIIADQIDVTGFDKVYHKLIYLYVMITEYEFALGQNHPDAIEEPWHHLLLIDLYRKQCGNRNDKAANFNIGTEYSYLANIYIKGKVYSDAIKYLKLYKQHMENAGKEQSTVLLVESTDSANKEVYVADAILKLVEVYIFKHETEMTLLKPLLDEAHEILSRYCIEDKLALGMMVACYLFNILLNRVHGQPKDEKGNTKKVYKLINDSRILSRTERGRLLNYVAIDLEERSNSKGLALKARKYIDNFRSFRDPDNVTAVEPS